MRLMALYVGGGMRLMVLCGMRLIVLCGMCLIVLCTGSGMCLTVLCSDGGMRLAVLCGGAARWAMAKGAEGLSSGGGGEALIQAVSTCNNANTDESVVTCAQ